MTLLFRISLIIFCLVASTAAPLALAAPEDQAAPTATPTTGPTSTPVPCVNPPFGIVIDLENPQPGSTLASGQQVVMNGIAYDTGSTSGPGIAAVTIYLGDRDAGGLALGSAILGQVNPAAPAGSPFANAGFSLRTSSLPTGSGARTIFVYARSVVGNAEGILQVPIFLNSAPTAVRGQVPTPVLPPPPACTPTPTPVPTATPTTPPVPGAAPAGAATPTATPTSIGPPTPTPFTLPAPLPPAPAPAAPAAPAPAAPAAAAPAAVAPAATTAPRGGGIPSEVGFLLLGVGAVIFGGGYALRRRERTRD